MKIFALILSVLILCLTLTPCQDRISCHSMQKTEMAHKSDAGHHDETNDGCSPFCNCQCCQAGVHIPTQPLTLRVHRVNYTYHEPAWQLTNQYITEFYTPPQHTRA